VTTTSFGVLLPHLNGPERLDGRFWLPCDSTNRTRLYRAPRTCHPPRRCSTLRNAPTHLAATRATGAIPPPFSTCHHHRTVHGFGFWFTYHYTLLILPLVWWMVIPLGCLQQFRVGTFSPTPPAGGGYHTACIGDVPAHHATFHPVVYSLLRG